MRSQFLAFVLMSVAAAGCTGPKMAPVETGPGTLQAARKYLEGRWTLVSYEIVRPGQQPIQLKGGGLLTYDSFGNLDIEVQASDPAVAAELARAGVPLTNGVLSTKGRTRIDMQGRTLSYVLDEKRPVATEGDGPLALNRPRHWVVEGNVLTLTIKDDKEQPLAVSKWQKVN